MKTLRYHARRTGRRPGRGISRLFTRKPSPAHALIRAGLGAVSGFAGTLALQVVRSASQKWLPSTVPDEREDPGAFMVRKAEKFIPERVQERIGTTAEKAAARSLGIGYGMTFGTIYGLLRKDADDDSVLIDGLAVGLGCWAVGYLGWLPATGLMEPVWRQQPAEAIAPALRHALYGIVTAAIYQQLSRRV